MDILEKEKKLLKLEEELKSLDDPSAIKQITSQIKDYKQEMMTELNAWDKVLLARHPKRPNAQDVIDHIFEDFIEMKGDRLYSDDRAIIGGVAFYKDRPVTIIAQQKGKTTEDNIHTNFGMPHPEGYRKALRLMRQAEKFKRPIVTFIDTPGAFPGIGAEARGQSNAISENLFAMSDMEVPVIAIVLGEGGSGGALAIGVGNHVYMLEHSIYSILSPEGYASILWKDSTLAQKAAEVMKITASDLLEFNMIEGIIPEPLGGAHHDYKKTFDSIDQTLDQALQSFNNKTAQEIKDQRYNKFRSLGFFQRFNYDNLKGVIS